MSVVAMRIVAGAASLVALACNGAQSSDTTRLPDSGRVQVADSMWSDSAADAFAREARALLLDTHLHELRGQLHVKVRNPNRDDESPLMDQAVQHPPAPGPHTYTGVLTAELGVLRSLLGDSLRISTERERVFVGEPPVLILGHFHGNSLFVPVKLFARQYGAYVDVSCPLANCAFVWPADIIRHMREIGFTGSTGMLEGHAEGIVRDLDVRKLPGG